MPRPSRRGLLTVLAVLAAASASAPARADDEIHGVEVGLRVGYGVPLGSEQADVPMSNAQTPAQDNALSNAVSHSIPFELDLGYRLLPELYVGAHAQYAIVGLSNGIGGGASSLPGDICTQGGVNCSGNQLRLGVDVQVHFLPRTRWDPWAGFGLGYESLSTKVEILADDGSGSVVGSESGTDQGLEASLQAGLDYKLSPQLGVGPFVMLSVGQYRSSVVHFVGNGIDDTSGTTVTHQAAHEWFSFGLRGTYTLF